MNELLRAQLEFCVVWVPLRNAKTIGNWNPDLPLLLQLGYQIIGTPSQVHLPMICSQNGGLNRCHWPVATCPSLLLMWSTPAVAAHIQKRVTWSSLRLPGQGGGAAEGFQSGRWECLMSRQAWINIVQVYCAVGVASVSDTSGCGRVTAQVHAVWRGNAISYKYGKGYVMFSEPKRINLVLKNTAGGFV